MDGARVCLWRFSYLALWVVVVDISQVPARTPLRGFKGRKSGLEVSPSSQTLGASPAHSPDTPETSRTLPAAFWRSFGVPRR